MPMLAITRDGRLHLLVRASKDVCVCGLIGIGAFVNVFQASFEEFRRDRVRCEACLVRWRN